MFRLYQEFLHEQWITPRFRKLMAGPKRWPWKNYRELKRDIRVTWFYNFVIGAILTSPLAIWFARKQQQTSGGVPVIRYSRWVHDFPQVEPSVTARNVFRRNFYGVIALGGITFAYWRTDESLVTDEWYSRPDKKPFPAMVAKEDMSITERTMYETTYRSWRQKKYKDEKKHRSWYRLFFPLDADYSTERNPYAQTHRHNVYNPANHYYPTAGRNHFRDHLNE